MKYRMLGVDLDGTLLNSSGKLSAGNLAALRRAQDAGILVVPCTGRAWSESHRALAQAAHLQLGVFVTGAAVTEMPSGRSLNVATIAPDLAMQIVHVLDDLPEAVLVFRDANRAGHDYLVTGRGKLTGNTAWWFEQMDITVHFQPVICEDDLHHTLRVGMVAQDTRMQSVLPQLEQALGDRIKAHAFVGLQMPERNQTMHVLEVFAHGVDKWTGLQWIAAEHHIHDSQIAVIGDEINDLPMFTASACPIAMGNAAAIVRHAAHYITLTNDEDGVAHAIEQLLSGQWG